MSAALPWLFWGGYGLGYLWVWRRAAWVAAHDGYGEVERGDIAFGIVFGALVALVWPLVVPGYMLWNSEVTGGWFLRAPGPHAKRERIESQQERIRELERELNIR